jgi:peptide/nickel transport system ATP-binding protein
MSTIMDDEASRAFVQVRNLTRRFDVSSPWLNRLLQREPRRILTAVDEVNFDIARGSTYALVGESGSGKSTIAKLVLGLLAPSSGQVLIDGTDLSAGDAAANADVRRRVQMIFQDPHASLNPRWRVGDIISEPLEAFGLVSGSGGRERRVAELLDQVGLSAADASKFPHQFSGGQRQRIGIARALASNPEFIVCDEPTSALDVSVQAQVLNLMRDLQAELGLTYLFITHDLSVVQYMADTVGVLYLGRLVETADRDALFASPRHPYTRMLLDAAPRLDGFGREHVTDGGEIPDPINPPAGCHYHPRCPLANSRCQSEIPLVRAVHKSHVACHEAERLGGR